jgi:hypothetical protein
MRQSDHPLRPGNRLQPLASASSLSPGYSLGTSKDKTFNQPQIHADFPQIKSDAKTVFRLWLKTDFIRFYPPLSAAKLHLGLCP